MIQYGTVQHIGQLRDEFSDQCRQHGYGKHQHEV